MVKIIFFRIRLYSTENKGHTLFKDILFQNGLKNYKWWKDNGE